VADDPSPEETGPVERRSWWHAARADVGPLRRSREFRLLFVGQAVSTLGTMLTFVALPYQAYRLSHSSLIVGLLSLIEVIPILTIGLVGGALADAFDRRRLVLAADIGLAGCSGLLVANSASGHPELWALFLIAFLMAAFGALQRPSLDSLLPRVVEKADIPAATALSSLRSNLGQVAGPALAGVLIGVIGLSAVYGIDVATFAVSFVALGRMAAVPPPPDAERPSLARIVEGFRYARSRQDLLGTYAVDMAAMFFGMPEALFPQLASRIGGPAILGLLFSAPAVGSLVVSATAGWVHRYSKSTEMLSRRAMRRIASPKSPATETTSTFSDRPLGWVSTLSVMNNRSIGLASRRSLAGPSAGRGSPRRRPTSPPARPGPGRRRRACPPRS
jgi:MFS family permease